MYELYIHKDNMHAAWSLHSFSQKSTGDMIDKYPDCDALSQYDCVCGV